MSEQDILELKEYLELLLELKKINELRYNEEKSEGLNESNSNCTRID